MCKNTGWTLLLLAVQGNLHGADAYCNAMRHAGYGPRTSTDFPPGWNGLAKTPFTGWRSWYAFYTAMNQSMIKDVIDALAEKNRTVKGWEGKVSLCDLGYCAAGIDEGWEGCGLGANGTQHYLNGTPATNPKLFPDMKELVEYGHKKNVKMGWYFNGCGCIESREPVSGWDVNYEGDIRLLAEYGFDGVKFDGCGSMCNMTEYAALMSATGKAFEIENCHWSVVYRLAVELIAMIVTLVVESVWSIRGDCTVDDGSSCPTADWCPFNWYRTSGDSNNKLGTWYDNLQTTIRFQEWDAPLSQPGCWAYPDMLQVGRLGCSSRTSGCPVPPQYEAWTRTHFAAFCIVSSPLVLSIYPSDRNLAPILDIIGNKQAMAVNQAWAGHPGTLLRTLPPADKVGAGASAGALPPDTQCRVGEMPGGDIHMANMTIIEGVIWCKNHAHCGGFTAEALFPASCTTVNENQALNETTTTLALHFKDPWGAARSNSDTKYTSWIVGGPRPVAGVQIWAKPLGSGKVAALFINGGSTNASTNITLAELNITSSTAVTVTDVWTGEDRGPVVNGAWDTGLVPSLDSRFVTFETKVLATASGDWRRNEPSGLGPEYRVVALAATLTVPLSLFSQWLSVFVSTLEALNFQPEGLANSSAEGWWPLNEQLASSTHRIVDSHRHRLGAVRIDRRRC